MTINILANLGGATQLLTSITARLDNPAPALEAIKDEALKSIDQNFEVGGRPAWEPLKYRQGTPLTLTAHLRQSITGEVQGNTATLSTDVPYAPVHQYGATIQLPEISAKNGQALRWFD